ncbi:MAG: DUF559 domain-containing protein [Solirubrobacteraceae bacterium]
MCHDSVVACENFGIEGVSQAFRGLLAFMGGPGREQRTKLRRANGPWCEVRPEAEVRTSIVRIDGVWRFVRDLGAGDRAAVGVAARQLALITAEQLYAAGLTKDAIVTRRRRGILHLVHRGVYVLGHPLLLPGARELAGVLACGESAVISHRSAVGLWGISSLPAGVVDVSVVGQQGRKRRGLRVHRVTIDNADRRLKHGIPITSPARTLFDFAAQAESDELERAIAEAYARGLVTETELRSALERSCHRKGAALLRAELAREGGPAWTRSEAERRMKELLRQARLPPPQVNVPVAGFVADFLWPAHGVIVEVDGYQFHGHRAAFEKDHRKQTVLAAAGYRVIRVTWRQLEQEPMAVIAAIAQALADAGYGSRAQH